MLRSAGSTLHVYDGVPDLTAKHGSSALLKRQCVRVSVIGTELPTEGEVRDPRAKTHPTSYIGKK